MKFYFTCHGQSEANILKIISNRDLPHALTEKGQQQARALAGRLSGNAFERIISSPTCALARHLKSSRPVLMCPVWWMTGCASLTVTWLKAAEMRKPGRCGRALREPG